MVQLNLIHVAYKNLLYIFSIELNTQGHFILIHIFNWFTLSCLHLYSFYIIVIMGYSICKSIFIDIFIFSTKSEHSWFN